MATVTIEVKNVVTERYTLDLDKYNFKSLEDIKHFIEKSNCNKFGLCAFSEDGTLTYEGEDDDRTQYISRMVIDEESCDKIDDEYICPLHNNTECDCMDDGLYIEPYDLTIAV